MKKHLLALLLSGAATAVSGQQTSLVFHPINAFRPQKQWDALYLRRLDFRKMTDLLSFAASEFDVPKTTQLAVLLNSDFVGQIDGGGHFRQLLDEKKLELISIDSVKMVVAEFAPDFQTQWSKSNFYGKINVVANPVKPPDTVTWNRFEPQQIAINRRFFNSKQEEFATASLRGGFFIGTVSEYNSFHGGAWLEIPLSQKTALQSEFSFTWLRELLGKVTNTPFDESTFDLHDWKARIDFKRYLRLRYQRPFLLGGCFVGRATGKILDAPIVSPIEFLGPNNTFGIRIGGGIQFFSGFFGAISWSPIFKNLNLLPFQNSARTTIVIGLTFGKA